MLPRSTQMTLAVGKAIVVPKVANPSQNLVEYYHARYFHSLSELFSKYKSCAGRPNDELKFTVEIPNIKKWGDILGIGPRSGVTANISAKPETVMLDSSTGVLESKMKRPIMFDALNSEKSEEDQFGPKTSEINPHSKRKVCDRAGGEHHNHRKAKLYIPEIVIPITACLLLYVAAVFTRLAFS